MSLNKIFLSPHNDDESLFGCYTILREKPLVVIVTDSYIEHERGDKATTQQRIEETKQACKLMGVEVQFLHIPDKSLNADNLAEAFSKLKADIVYAPAVEIDGNRQHNLVGAMASIQFNTIHYMTYTLHTTKSIGTEMIIPTEEEKKIKAECLKCYPSQLAIPTTAPFFENKQVLDFESYA